MIPLPRQWDRDGIEIMIPTPYQWDRDESGIMISPPSRSRDLIFDSAAFKFTHSMRAVRSRNSHTRDGKCDICPKAGSRDRVESGTTIPLSWRGDRDGIEIMIPTPYQWVRDENGIVISLPSRPRDLIFDSVAF